MSANFTTPFTQPQFQGWASFFGGNVQAPMPPSPSVWGAAALGQPPSNGQYTGGWAYPNAWANFYEGKQGFVAPQNQFSPAGALAATQYARNTNNPNDPNLLGWEQAYGNPNTILAHDQNWAQSLGPAPTSTPSGKLTGGWQNPEAWAAYYGGSNGFTAPANAGSPASALAAASQIAATSNPQSNPALLGWVQDYGQPGSVLTNTPNWAASLGAPKVDALGNDIGQTNTQGWTSPLAWAAFYGGFQGFGKSKDNTLQAAQNFAGITDKNDPSLLGWELDYGNPQTVVSTIQASKPYQDYLAAVRQFKIQQADNAARAAAAAAAAAAATSQPQNWTLQYLQQNPNTVVGYGPANSLEIARGAPSYTYPYTFAVLNSFFHYYDTHGGYSGHSGELPIGGFNPVPGFNPSVLHSGFVAVPGSGYSGGGGGGGSIAGGIPGLTFNDIVPFTLAQPGYQAATSGLVLGGGIYTGYVSGPGQVPGINPRSNDVIGTSIAQLAGGNPIIAGPIGNTLTLAGMTGGSNFMPFGPGTGEAADAAANRAGALGGGDFQQQYAPISFLDAPGPGSFSSFAEANPLSIDAPTIDMGFAGPPAYSIPQDAFIAVAPGVGEDSSVSVDDFGRPIPDVGPPQPFDLGGFVQSVQSALGNLGAGWIAPAVSSEPTFAQFPFQTTEGPTSSGTDLSGINPNVTVDQVAQQIPQVPLQTVEPTFAQLPFPAATEEPTFATFDYGGVASAPTDVFAADLGFGAGTLYQGGYAEPTLGDTPWSLPPPQPISKAEQFIQDVGANTTIAQIAEKTGHPLDAQAIYWLGQAADMPIDLSQPLGPQLSSNILNAPDAGAMKDQVAAQAVEKYNQTTAEQSQETGMSVQQIRQAVMDAASDVQQDVAEGPGAYGPAAPDQTYTTVPVYGTPPGPNYNPTGIRPPADVGPQDSSVFSYDVGSGYGGGPQPSYVDSVVLTAAQATSGAPAAVLQQAAAMVASGHNTAQLQQWMADQGYPQWFNWCAEFVSAVQQGMGNPPPAAVPYGEFGGPRVTSGWTTWGQPREGAPQAGDVFVRGGSGDVGQGGHAGMVYQSGPDGQVTVIQGNPASEYTTTAGQLEQQGFQFRAPPGEISSEAAGVLTAPPQQNVGNNIDWGNLPSLGAIPDFPAEQASPGMQAGYSYIPGSFGDSPHTGESILGDMESGLAPAGELGHVGAESQLDPLGFGAEPTAPSPGAGVNPSATFDLVAGGNQPIDWTNLPSLNFLQEEDVPAAASVPADVAAADWPTQAAIDAMNDPNIGTPRQAGLPQSIREQFYKGYYGPLADMLQDNPAALARFLGMGRSEDAPNISAIQWWNPYTNQVEAMNATPEQGYQELFSSFLGRFLSGTTNPVERMSDAQALIDFATKGRSGWIGEMQHGWPSSAGNTYWGDQFTPLTEQSASWAPELSGLEALLAGGPLAPTQSVGNWSANSSFARLNQTPGEFNARGIFNLETISPNPLSPQGTVPPSNRNETQATEEDFPAFGQPNYNNINPADPITGFGRGTAPYVNWLNQQIQGMGYAPLVGSEGSSLDLGQGFGGGDTTGASFVPQVAEIPPDVLSQLSELSTPQPIQQGFSYSQEPTFADIAPQPFTSPDYGTLPFSEGFGGGSPTQIQTQIADPFTGGNSVNLTHALYPVGNTRGAPDFQVFSGQPNLDTIYSPGNATNFGDFEGYVDPSNVGPMNLAINPGVGYNTNWGGVSLPWADDYNRIVLVQAPNGQWQYMSVVDKGPNQTARSQGELDILNASLGGFGYTRQNMPGAGWKFQVMNPQGPFGGPPAGYGAISPSLGILGQ